MDIKDCHEVPTEREPIPKTEINIGPTVTEEQQTELVEVLNEFRECFAMILSESGCTSVSEMNTVAPPSSTPLPLPPLRTNAEGRETIRKRSGKI